MTVPTKGAIPGLDTPGYIGSRWSVGLDFHSSYLSAGSYAIASSCFSPGDAYRDLLEAPLWGWHYYNWTFNRNYPTQPIPSARQVVSQGMDGNNDPPMIPPPHYHLYVPPWVANNNAIIPPPSYLDSRNWACMAFSLHFLYEEGRLTEFQDLLTWVLQMCGDSSTVDQAIQFIWNEANNFDDLGGPQRYHEDWSVDIIGCLNWIKENNLHQSNIVLLLEQINDRNTLSRISGQTGGTVNLTINPFNDVNTLSIITGNTGGDGGVPVPSTSNTGIRPGNEPTWFIGSTTVNDSWLAQNNGVSHGGFKNVQFTDGVWYVRRVSVDGKFIIRSNAGVVFQDCETDGKATAGQVGSDYGFTYFSDVNNLGNNVTLEYCDIHNCTTGFQALNNWKVFHTYIHDVRSDGFKGGYGLEVGYSLITRIAMWDGSDGTEYPHGDGWQCGQGNGSWIHHNYFDIPYPPPPGYANPNSALFVKGDGNAIRNVLMEDNWIRGGGYSVYITSNGYVIENVTLRNNKFVQGSMEYGGLTSADIDWISDPEVTVTGNRWWDHLTNTVGDVIKESDPGGFAQE